MPEIATRGKPTTPNRHVSAPGLSLFYGFEGVGLDLRDWGPRRRHAARQGTPAGVTGWVAGPFGPCYQFDDASVRFSWPGATLAAGVPFTVAWWERFLPTAGTTTHHDRMIFQVDGSASGNGFAIFRGADAFAGVSVGGAASGALARAFGTAPSIAASLAIGRSFALVATAGPISNDAGSLTLWVDGEPHPPTASVGLGVGSMPNENRIGAGTLGNPSCWLDAVRVYDRALAPAEIRALAGSPFVGASPSSPRGLVDAAIRAALAPPPYAAIGGAIPGVPRVDA